MAVIKKGFGFPKPLNMIYRVLLQFYKFHRIIHTVYLFKLCKISSGFKHADV
jgi:hypothetical protein